jgi:hypothetical protein
MLKLINHSSLLISSGGQYINPEIFIWDISLKENHELIEKLTISYNFLVYFFTIL